MRRSDVESDKRYFRSETRVFNLNGLWHFATREGDQGPFSSRELAEKEAHRYADDWQVLCGFQESREAGNVGQRNATIGLSILPLEGKSEETARVRWNLALESD